MKREEVEDDNDKLSESVLSHLQARCHQPVPDSPRSLSFSRVYKFEGDEGFCVLYTVLVLLPSKRKRFEEYFDDMAGVAQILRAQAPKIVGGSCVFGIEKSPFSAFSIFFSAGQRTR